MTRRDYPERRPYQAPRQPAPTADTAADERFIQAQRSILAVRDLTAYEDWQLRHISQTCYIRIDRVLAYLRAHRHIEADNTPLRRLFRDTTGDLTKLAGRCTEEMRRRGILYQVRESKS